MPWLLDAAIVLQVWLGQYVEAAVVGGLLAFNAILGVLQEGRASAALAALKQRLAPTALVRRDGEWIRRPAAAVVPGDAIRLALGAVVPADARIVSGSVIVDQSTVTGESVPVDASPGDQVFAGTLVRRGQAVAEVTATGAHTYFGRAAELVRVARGASTEQAAILGAVRSLAVVNGALALLTVSYASLMAWPAADVIRLALTALLASIPVALPATFTLSAAIGAQRMARHGVLLTRLSAAHEAAAMDVLCADKTGTLTRNALEVEGVSPMPGFDRARVMALAVRASSEADQDRIDAAIRRAAGEADSGEPAERLVRFVPFDPATKMRRRLSSIAMGTRCGSSRARSRRSARSPTYPRRPGASRTTSRRKDIASSPSRRVRRRRPVWRVSSRSATRRARMPRGSSRPFATWACGPSW